MEKKATKKERNPVIICICLIVLGLLGFLVIKVYNNIKEKRELNEPINEIITEIKYSEMENYFKENPDVMLFLINPEDEDMKNIKKALIKITKNYDTHDQLVYLDYTTIKNENILNEITSKYFNENLINHNYSFKTNPNLLYFRDGVVFDIMVKNESIEFTEPNIVQFLEIYEVIDNE